MEYASDFLIIGSGLAGLGYALKVARHGTVNVVTKRSIMETSTRQAQGGIAAVLSPDDSFDLHIKDTLASGDGLCHQDTVELVVRSGPERIQELVNLGAHFDLAGNTANDFDLTREGGHSRRRIIHAHDMTGQEVESILVARVLEQSNITVFENQIAVDLITRHKLVRRGAVTTNAEESCVGAYVLDTNTGQVNTFIAPIILLATGGAGKVYLYTSNPDIATGDGVAIAYRAGANIANMEFIQFHPTCLYHPQAKNFLISEAVRGEGGILVDKHGKPFMAKYHPLKDLAFRDVVARAIDTELKKTGDDCVFLDISHKSKDFVKARFPGIHQQCLEFGIDITTQPIPVVPAAHYSCGGVVTDLLGRTNIHNLYAVGEVAMTGLHGANRLASNSLLEALVFSHEAARTRRGNAPPDSQAEIFRGAPLGPPRSHRQRRKRRGHPELGRNPPVYVELCGDCALGQAPEAGPQPHRPDSAGNQRLLLEFFDHQRPGGAQKYRHRRRPHHYLRSATQRKPGLTLYPGLPRQRRGQLVARYHHYSQLRNNFPLPASVLVSFQVSWRS